MKVLDFSHSVIYKYITQIYCKLVQVDIDGYISSTDEKCSVNSYENARLYTSTHDSTYLS